jgi:hypothetical protein
MELLFSLMFYIPMTLPFTVGLFAWNASIFIRCFVISVLIYLISIPVAFVFGMQSSEFGQLMWGAIAYSLSVFIFSVLSYGYLFKKYIKISITKRGSYERRKKLLKEEIEYNLKIEKAKAKWLEAIRKQIQKEL